MCPKIYSEKNKSYHFRVARRQNILVRTLIENFVKKKIDENKIEHYRKCDITTKISLFRLTEPHSSVYENLTLNLEEQNGVPVTAQSCNKPFYLTCFFASKEMSM